MWVTIKAERVLRVARGRDVILCSDDMGKQPEIVVLLSPEAVAALRKQTEQQRAMSEDETVDLPGFQA